VSTFLFGVLPADAAAAPPDGVRALDTPAGRAWVRSGDAAPDARERRAVLLAALDAGETPAPARAGARFDDDDALVAALARSADAWRAALARVRGAVEMLVFAPLAPRDTTGDTTGGATEDDARGEPLDPAASPGRAYLDRLRRRAGGDPRADALRRSLRDALGDAVLDDATVTHASGRGLMVSHLVRRAARPAYDARLDAWRARPDAPRVVVLGPFPPYSFAEVALGASASEAA
jgi:hypothetical protein